MIPFAKPMIGMSEIGAVIASLHNSRLTEGPLVDEFETMFGDMHHGHAVAVTSCTAALAMCSGSIRDGEVEIPAMTHVATAHALQPCKLKFVDCDENGITKTNGVVSVSFMGAPTHPSILADLACAVGMKSQSRWACYSFYPAKHITTGEGGMILCKHEHEAKTFRQMRAFGKTMKDGKFDVVGHGLNFRMSEINAALGIEQLKKLPEWLKIRKRNWDVLAKELRGIMRVLDTSGGSYYALAAYVPDGVDREAFRQRLLAAGVETSVYYPVPVPHLTYYRQIYKHRRGDFPNAERVAERTVAFPVGPHIGDNEIEQIVKAVRKLL